MSIATVVSGGFGSFGSVNFLPTLGFGTYGTQVTGRVLRRGRIRIKYDESADYEEQAEDLTLQIEALAEERNVLITQVRLATRNAELAAQRIELARAFRAKRDELDKEIQRLRSRRRRIQEIGKQLLRIRTEQEDEDMRVIAFIIDELYN